MKNYTIEMRPTSDDSFESIESAYNRKLVSGKAVHTNKREAEKEMRRLQAQVKAGNELRKLEGSRERHYYQFRITEAEDITRKQFAVKPEHWDAWFGGMSTDEIGDAIVTGAEIRRLSGEWGTDIADLMNQVEALD